MDGLWSPRIHSSNWNHNRWAPEGDSVERRWGSVHPEQHHWGGKEIHGGNDNAEGVWSAVGKGADWGGGGTLEDSVRRKAIYPSIVSAKQNEGNWV